MLSRSRNKKENYETNNANVLQDKTISMCILKTIL